VRTLAQLLPPTEGGYSSAIMTFTFNEADFLMHCIELFSEDTRSSTPPSFTDQEGKEVVLDSKQIENLYLRIQDLKFANR